MTVKISKIYPFADFGANISPITINEGQNRFLYGMNFSLKALQDGSSVPTIANLMSVLDKYTFKVGTSILQQCSLTDIYALSALSGGASPQTTISSGDNNLLYAGGFFVPLSIDPTASTISVSLDYSAPTNADNVQVELEMISLEPRMQSSSFSGPIKLTKNSFTTNGIDSSSYSNVQDSFTTTGTLRGILVKSETVPTGATAYNRGTLSDVLVTVGGINQLEFDFLSATYGIPNGFSYQSAQSLQNSPDDYSILTNYRYIPLNLEPIPAFNQVQFLGRAGVSGENVDIIYVEQLPKIEEFSIR